MAVGIAMCIFMCFVFYFFICTCQVFSFVFNKKIHVFPCYSVVIEYRHNTQVNKDMVDKERDSLFMKKLVATVSLLQKFYLPISEKNLNFQQKSFIALPVMLKTGSTDAQRLEPHLDKR